MRRAAAVVFCSACVVGPKLVSAPMLSSVPVAEVTIDASAGDDAEAPPEETPARLEGSWTGHAWQTGNSSFTLNVTFESRGADVVAQVHYPEQHCRAEWRLRRGEHQQWVGEENVLVDPFTRCPRRGHVIVTPAEDGTLHWNWTAPGRSATANLEREQP
ncbi:MAG TPA: hypothetical protein VGH28_27890 [Polyangiaceae bacterium]|jgi:hypothetical protein